MNGPFWMVTINNKKIITLTYVTIIHMTERIVKPNCWTMAFYNAFYALLSLHLWLKNSQETISSMLDLETKNIYACLKDLWHKEVMSKDGQIAGWHFFGPAQTAICPPLVIMTSGIMRILMILKLHWRFHAIVRCSDFASLYRGITVGSPPWGRLFSKRSSTLPKKNHWILSFPPGNVS